jgi:hypothetical protein
MKTTEENSFLTSNEMRTRNWMRISAYGILSVSLILLISFLISFFALKMIVPYTELAGEYILRDTIMDTFLLNFPESIWFPVTESTTGLLPNGSFYTLIFACIGFVSFVSVTYADGAMILESKSWLTDLQEQGLINNFNAFKNLTITTKNGKIIISKNNMKYRIKLPKLENDDLTRFGLVLRDNWVTCFCTRKELTSILYIYLSKVN